MKKSIVMSLAAVAALGSALANAQTPAEGAPSDIPGLQAVENDGVARSSKNDDSVKFQFEPGAAAIPAAPAEAGAAVPAPADAAPIAPVEAEPVQVDAPPALPAEGAMVPAAPADGGINVAPAAQ
ncbi:flagellar hook-length control protein FliK [Neisseria wadsworthii]|uniref:Flagellar hook-length control protein FliK n=1 Tax=Neisseria wadsworthii 9715 TaxID=1030841 RepID=G4CSF2_9NEIS|nr:flagellar hook-length control protein FliK [Neisseria wadsworthii]EGZ44768.1 flagellar hook-length control protein FliK [Neisseria wadsworthii 9715]QMT35641.1 hypothetical protein H3L96_11635 [Neisseria wadsworthii]